MNTYKQEACLTESTSWLKSQWINLMLSTNDKRESIWYHNSVFNLDIYAVAWFCEEKNSELINVNSQEVKG